MKIELQGMESCGGHNNLILPVLISGVVVLHGDGKTPEECHVRHMQVLLNHQLIQVNEFYFDNFDRLPASSELEIDEEQTVSQFCNNKSVKRRVVGEDELCASNVSLSSWPVNGMS